MRNFILGLLLLRPMSLYEVHAQFAAGLSHIYAASYGSIHRSLKQLLSQGDLACADEPASARNRRRYVVTDQGRRTWLAWMKEPASTENAEVAALARVFLLGLVDDRPTRLSVLASLRARALAEHEALLGIDNESGDRENDATGARYRAATVHYGVAASRNLVDWLDKLATTENPVPAGEKR
ncbi:PadR family transcriptional regulator [Saccharomonospora azurea]|uniref:PadR family transcriptional regulator n=1 Tax=Saccharomonospora azurea TaxID=40988 RepID=UPI003329AF9B